MYGGKSWPVSSCFLTGLGFAETVENGYHEEELPVTIKCETDCRDEIYAKMDSYLPKSILWKAILFVGMLCGAASAVYGTGLTERKEAIKANTTVSMENAKNIAVIGRDLDYIRKSQTATNEKLDMILREARIEVKRRID